MLKSILPVTLICLMHAAAVLAAPASSPEHAEFFETRIRPLLSDKCLSCHGEEKQKGGLRLDSRAAILQGGDSGAAIVPGDAEASHLILAVRYQDDDLKMPPKNPLTKSQVDDLVKWVQAGAVWPGGDGAVTAAPKRGRVITEEDRSHWAFLPLRNSTGGHAPTAGANPVDAFIDDALREAGLAPSPRADKRTLLRRVYFDLIGLPPTPAQIAEFLADDSPRAFEKVVDELLQSPHYGERWARHWLDLARFAESNGHNRDPDKPNMWRYRDYVIQSFNADQPYDEFLREQIAGDLMPPRAMADGKTNARLAATGLWWSYELVYNPAEPAEQRADQVDSQIDIFSKTFLGLSLACARCHDHKTDPILTRDYYALAGIFHSTKGTQRPVDVKPQPAAPVLAARQETPKTDAMIRDARRKEILRAKEYMLASLPLISMPGADALREAEEIAKERGLNLTVLRRWVTFCKLNDSPRNPNVGPWIQIVTRPREGFTTAVQDVLAKREKGAAGNKPFNALTVAALSAQDSTSPESLAEKYAAIMLQVFDGQRESDPVHHQWLNWFRRPDTPYTISVFGGTPEPKSKTDSGIPMAMAAADADDARFEVYQNHENLQPDAWSLPRDPSVGDVPVHIRGQVGSYGEIAPRGFLTVLPDGGPAEIKEGSGRRELAAWLTGPAAPLVARVMANRLWQHHFGTGIVDTPNDFGITGNAPSHPALLDFLAAKFIEGGWSVKAMHRLMVLSDAYRRESRATDEAAERDPSNRLLSHMPIRRLEGEAVRDAILLVSGSLDPKPYGPGVTPYITEFMYPRFRPKSGPLDGEGRRSIYITVRRNFLTPMLTAFDFPNPSEPIGRREVSNVPTQALTLLNNEFIHEQARLWGARAAKSAGSDEQRVTAMFETALGRSPDAEELAAMLSFVRDEGDPEVRWTDLAHAILNTKDFIFIR